jgi:hypothetical protein
VAEFARIPCLADTVACLVADVEKLREYLHSHEFIRKHRKTYGSAR